MRRHLRSGTGACALALVLVGGLAGARGAVAGPWQLPKLTDGVAAGDVTATSAIVWTRASGLTRVGVEVSRSPRFRGARRLSARTSAELDFTVAFDIGRLRPATRYYYRLRALGPGRHGPASTGTFRTAPGRGTHAPVRFVFGGDVGSGNYCRSVDWGLPIFFYMSKVRPDFFVALGDMIYADSTCPADGPGDWRNLPGAFPGIGEVDWRDPEKVRAAFLEHWRYTRADRHLRYLLSRNWSVSLFALNHGPAPSAADEDVLRELCERVELEPFDASSLARYRRLAGAVSTRTAFQRRFFFSSAAAERLAGRLRSERFDAFVAESLYMYPYLPADARRVTVLDTLNAEVRRVQAMAAVLGRRPRGLVARLQLEPVRRFEAEAAQGVARVVAVSDEEARYFEGLAPGRVDVVPNGVDCEGIATRSSLPAEPRLLFVGSMDYSANVDAVEHLIDDVLPRLGRSDAVVELVGSNPRPTVRRAAERSGVSVEVHGQVPSTEPYFERARLLVVPLRFGGGTRLKILEALARGVPVVSTTLGCEGLGLAHERDVVVADSPAELAAWIDRLLEDDDLCRRLSREGRATVEERYDWRRLGETFEAVVRGVAAKAPP